MSNFHLRLASGEYNPVPPLSYVSGPLDGQDILQCVGGAAFGGIGMITELDGRRVYTSSYAPVRDTEVVRGGVMATMPTGVESPQAEVTVGADVMRKKPFKWLCLQVLAGQLGVDYRGPLVLQSRGPGLLKRFGLHPKGDQRQMPEKCQIVAGAGPQEGDSLLVVSGAGSLRDAVGSMVGVVAAFDLHGEDRASQQVASALGVPSIEVFNGAYDAALGSSDPASFRQQVNEASSRSANVRGVAGHNILGTVGVSFPAASWRDRP